MTMRPEVVGELIAQRQRLFEELAATPQQARPATNFLGFRDGWQVVSISSRPQAKPKEVADRFAAACMLLDAFRVDEICLLTGDELAEVVLDPRDLDEASRGMCSVVLVAGPQPVGVLVPYQMHRRRSRIVWGTARWLDRSLADGLWATVLVPHCFAGELPSDPATVAGLMRFNAQFDNDVYPL